MSFVKLAMSLSEGQVQNFIQRGQVQKIVSVLQKPQQFLSLSLGQKKCPWVRTDTDIYFWFSKNRLAIKHKVVVRVDELCTQVQLAPQAIEELRMWAVSFQPFSWQSLSVASSRMCDRVLRVRTLPLPLNIM